jgi:hypothetical protein
MCPFATFACSLHLHRRKLVLALSHHWPWHCTLPSSIHSGTFINAGDILVVSLTFMSGEYAPPTRAARSGESIQLSTGRDVLLLLRARRVQVA